MTSPTTPPIRWPPPRSTARPSPGSSARITPAIRASRRESTSSRLRVTDGTNTASLQSIANALQWVVANHATYKITVVNLSLSDGQNYAQNWFATTGGAAEQVTNLIGQLRGMNIPVVVAAGNNFNGQQGEGFAAIVQGTHQRHRDGPLRTPPARRPAAGHLDRWGVGDRDRGAGRGIQRTLRRQRHGPRWTARASPTALVSGSVVLLQQIYEQRFGTLPTVDQFQSWIQGGSDPINDPVTGITIGQLDIPKAAALIPAATATPAAPPSIVSTLQVTTASVAPTSSTLGVEGQHHDQPGHRDEPSGQQSGPTGQQSDSAGQQSDSAGQQPDSPSGSGDDQRADHQQYRRPIRRQRTGVQPARARPSRGSQGCCRA